MPSMGLMGRMGLMPLMDRGVVRKRRKKGRKEARHLTYAGAGGAASVGRRSTSGPVSRMPDLSPDTRRKLSAILGMLGSSFAGERDAAAQLANRIVRGAGVQWDELIAVPAPGSRREPPPPRPPPGWRERAQRCAAYPAWLSAWERQFVAGLGGLEHKAGRYAGPDRPQAA